MKFKTTLRLALGVVLLAMSHVLAAPVDLSTYVLVGRYDLPAPSNTPAPPAPPNTLLAQEASSITYNWDTDSLFVVGDGGTIVVQVSKTGQLIDWMILAAGSGGQGTEFLDTEGITYVGGGKFVMIEERERRANLFTYVPGGTLQRAAAQTVTLGTPVGNIGLEGLTYDPLTSGYILVKEKDPLSIFQTLINFDTGVASNGGPTATSSTNLFSPLLANLADFSDVFALANLPFLAGAADQSHLLILSQESGQIINVDRAGIVHSRLTIVAPPGALLSVPDMTMEGVTMDRNGILYVCNENGGGDSSHPQIWVYAHSDAPNTAPTGLTLVNQVPSIPANTSTAAAIKVADTSIADDGLGHNNLTLTGPDAGAFQIVGASLYLKAGTPLNSSLKPSYTVTVILDDPAVGNNPDATADYALEITPAVGGEASLIISEVAPWSSGNSPAALAVDWFEVSNIGTAAQDITDWRVDDNSHIFSSTLPLTGITSIAPGESVIFLEIPATLNNADGIAAKKNAFLSVWFGANPPPNLKIGTYSGGGIGLSATVDEVNLYSPDQALQAAVAFGASPIAVPFTTFDNAAGLNNATITTFSAVGINGAFRAANDSNEIGSPGAIGAPPTPTVTITAFDPDASELGDSGTFRISRTGSTVASLTVNYTVSTGSGQAGDGDYSTDLAGVALIPSGSSFVDLFLVPIDDPLLEGVETVTLTLFDTGSYDVDDPGSATIFLADHVIPPTPQAGIAVSRGGFFVDRGTGLLVQRVALSNTTASPIPGPIYLVIDSLSPNATPPLAPKTANVEPLGRPYFLAVPEGSSLAPGASVPIVLNFVNPNRGAVAYRTQVVSGGNTTP